MRTRFLLPAALLLQAVTSQGFTIVLNPTAGMDPLAQDGFRRAADYWESQFTDPVTVNLTIGFSALGSNILAQAGSSWVQIPVASVKSAMTFDVTSTSDVAAISHFPALSSGYFLSFLTQKDTEGGSTAVSLDNDTLVDGPNWYNNNAFLDLTTANAKALGFSLTNPPLADASITFSSAFSWDFDQSDGVGPGLQDFVGVAIHEIGHALGFVSGVDTVDYAISRQIDLDPYAIYSVLDLFRYSAAGTLNLAAGAEAYFSLDGGVTSLGGFSTGVEQGDGRQASHWKDNLGLGIMDPTANPAGQINTPSELDLLVFDVIGWDRISPVPEPGSVFGLMGLLCSSLLLRRRAR
jgi:hypothetical protein